MRIFLYSLFSMLLACKTNDENDLLQLTKEFYQWVEKDTHHDFVPFIKQENAIFYAGMDVQLQINRMNELKATQFFASEFLINYEQIAQTIDQKLRNQTWKWQVGYAPPFGNGANPWCNCQDFLPLEHVSIANLVIQGDEVTYNLTFGNNFSYRIKAKKVNKRWKISYLEGFDFLKFTHQN